MIPVVILAAGSGRRLGLVGERYPKILLPVGDGTLLSHHFRSFAAVGVRRFVMVVNDAASDLALVAHHQAASLGADLRLVVQEHCGGIGHATLAAEPHLHGGPFVLVLGDTYYIPRDLAGAMARLTDGRHDAVLSVREVDDADLIRKECTIEVGGTGLVRRIIEKPLQPLSRLKPCGVYFFGPALIEALRATPPSALRGEVEITDAIQTLVDRGGRVGIWGSLDLDVNITFPADVITANLAWLRMRRAASWVHPEATIAPDSTLVDSLVSRGGRVGARASLRRTVVFPEAVVPPGASLADALVLPDLGVVGS